MALIKALWVTNALKLMHLPVHIPKLSVTPTLLPMPMPLPPTHVVMSAPK